MRNRWATLPDSLGEYYYTALRSRDTIDTGYSPRSVAIKAFCHSSFLGGDCPPFHEECNYLLPITTMIVKRNPKEGMYLSKKEYF